MNFAPPEDQNQTNRPARACCNVMLLGFCDSHAYQVRASCGRRIGMCGYTSVSEDGRACLFVRLRISPLRIKLTESNFSGRFIGVHGRESPIFVNFAPPEAQNQTNGQRAGHVTLEMSLQHVYSVHLSYCTFVSGFNLRTCFRPC